MLIVVVWWVWMQAMGLAALPLAYRFFHRLPDRGYAFARPLGLLLTSYILWLAGSLGLLRNSVGGALTSLVVVAGLSVIVYRRGRAAENAGPGLWDWLHGHGRLVLAVEMLFAVALGLWAWLRSYSPELTTSGGEKFMEIMYLNSIGRSEYFPPNDGWLSGYAISYYYFGYVMIATLTRLVGTAAHLAFNVGLASLFALTCTGAFSIAYNLVAAFGRHEEAQQPGRRQRPVAFGLLGAVLVAVLGNLEGFLEVLYSARVLPEGFWRWLDILELNEPASGAASWLPTRSGWWWWRASRVINDLDPSGASMGIQPIDEFPGFSFLLGDMHPHVLALPFVLLALAVALHVLLDQAARVSDRHEEGPWWAAATRLPVLVPLCLGALGFLNTWDFPIYLVVFTAAYGLGRWQREGRLSWPLIRDMILTGATAAMLGFVLYLPFYIGFQSQAGGLLPTLYVGTRFRHYVVMFGPFLVAVGGLLLMLAARAKSEVPEARLVRQWVGWTAGLFATPFVLMAAVGLGLALTEPGREFLEGVRSIPAVHDIVGDGPLLGVLTRLLLVKLRTWVMPLVVAGMAALGLALLAALGRPPAIRFKTAAEAEGAGHSGQAGGWPVGPEQRAVVGFVVLCVAAGLLLTLAVEFVYLRDNFMVRMNTIFKFYFQAWVLMALASAFAVYWLGRQRGRLKILFLTGFWLLFAMGMVYPVLGNISRAGNFDHAPTLDGSAYLAASQPDDYAALQWLNEHVSGAPVILEKPGAGGDSYVYEGRVSALTGLPTLLGWAGHEGQWRGSYEVQAEREPDIKTLYNTTSIAEAELLLNEYGISYVYVGPLEQSEYDPRGLAKFERFMTVVYQEGAVTIYGR